MDADFEVEQVGSFTHTHMNKHTQIHTHTHTHIYLCGGKGQGVEGKE